jgi:hypothetical protein
MKGGGSRAHIGRRTEDDRIGGVELLPLPGGHTVDLDMDDFSAGNIARPGLGRGGQPGGVAASIVTGDRDVYRADRRVHMVPL